MAVIFALALPLCSPMPLPASPLPLWTFVDILAIGGQCSDPATLPVWICGCLLPLLSSMDPAP